MDDVVRRDHEPNARPRGDVDLVRADDAAAGIADLPPPLVPDHVDGEPGAAARGGRGRLQHEQVRPGEEGRQREDRHDDPERDDEPRRGPVAAPAGEPPAAPPQPTEQEQPRDDREADRRPGEHDPPEVGDPVRGAALGAQDVLAPPASREREHGGRERRERARRPPRTTSSPTGHYPPDDSTQRAGVPTGPGSYASGRRGVLR